MMEFQGRATLPVFIIIYIIINHYDYSPDHYSSSLFITDAFVVCSLCVGWDLIMPTTV